jgi:hypothetical protein
VSRVTAEKRGRDCRPYSCGPESGSPAVCRAQLGKLLTRSTCQLQHDLVVWFVQFKIEILKYWGVGPPRIDAYALDSCYIAFQYSECIHHRRVG